MNNIQQRLERSIFEILRKTLVAEGRLPEVANSARYPLDGEDLTQEGQTNWDTDLKAIRDAQKFAAEVFGHSSTQAKGTKKVPRLVIIPRRMLPGDIGFVPGHTILQDPLNPNSYVKIPNPSESTNMQLDIHIVSNTAEQDRFCHWILAKAIGQKRYLPFYDDPTERFFIKQYNFYDLPDPPEGIDEKVYSYEISDLYLFDTALSTPVSLIKEITVQTTLTEYQVILAENNMIIGPYVNDGNIYIDLSGFKFN